MKRLSWINFVLGLWLVVAPFALRYNMVPTATWNNVIVGIAVAALSIIRALEHSDMPTLHEQHHGA
ncbi:MAG: SPW repeat protein [Chloroflexota bacterium]